MSATLLVKSTADRHHEMHRVPRLSSVGVQSTPERIDDGSGTTNWNGTCALQNPATLVAPRP